MKANKEVGINLLNDLNRRNKFNLPNKIIGITANINDIGEFRESFLEHAVTVLEAPINNVAWIESIQKIILNTIDAYLSEEEEKDNKSAKSPRLSPKSPRLSPKSPKLAPKSPQLGPKSPKLSPNILV